MATLQVDIIVNDDGTASIKKFSQVADNAEKSSKNLEKSKLKLKKS